MQEIINQQPYPAEVMRLNDPEGFIDYYIGLVNSGMSKMEAYEAAESQHVRLFGRRKYSYYVSFKSAAKNKYRATI